jgi:mycothiol system anti-sigma-R factor
MISCSEFLAEIGNYLDGELNPELRRELEAHLAHCRTCQVVVDTTRKTLKIVTESGEMDLSEALPEPLVAKIMDRVRAKPTGESDGGAGS